MATEVILPRVDMDMETGKFANWLVKEGEAVTKGQPLFEIETDKAAMEVDAPAAGILKGVSAAPGDVLPVGATVAWIAAADESIPSVAKGAAHPLGQPSATDRREARAHAAPPKERSELDARGRGVDFQATPLARRLAREAGV